MKFEKLLDALKLREPNTKIEMCHCAKCARDNDMIARGLMTEDTRSCKEFGTLHGQRMPVGRFGSIFRRMLTSGNPALAMIATMFASFTMYNHNLITNVGHAGANGRMSNQGSYNPFINIAIGIGTNAAAATDTTLQSEITTLGGQRKAATASQIQTTVANDTTQLVALFSFTGAFAVTEEGIFDSASAGAGSLFARQVFAAQNVISGDSIQYTHTYKS